MFLPPVRGPISVQVHEKQNAEDESRRRQASKAHQQMDRPSVSECPASSETLRRLDDTYQFSQVSTQLLDLWSDGRVVSWLEIDVRDRVKY